MVNFNFKTDVVGNLRNVKMDENTELENGVLVEQGAENGLVKYQLTVEIDGKKYRQQMYHKEKGLTIENVIPLQSTSGAFYLEFDNVTNELRLLRSQQNIASNAIYTVNSDESVKENANIVAQRITIAKLNGASKETLNRIIEASLVSDERD